MKNFKSIYKIFLTIVVGVALFLISDKIFNPINLYYELPWLDIPMHIFGGLLLAAFYIYSYEHITNSKKFKLPNFWHILIFVLFIGVLWEIYEYVLDVYDARTWNGWRDTIFDLINDTIGLLLAYSAHKYFKGKDF